MNRLKEWISIKVVKTPRTIVLIIVLLGNTIFIGLATLIISWLASPVLEDNSYWFVLYNLLTMILGVGGTETIVEDLGASGLFLVLAVVIAVIIGLVVFTGTIIGYMSEVIGNFIEEADSDLKKVYMHDHIIILNWNNRAAEIINELLYKQTKEKIANQLLHTISIKNTIYKNIHY